LFHPITTTQLRGAGGLSLLLITQSGTKDQG
jgi:hypothetical protein